jgi:uncharacterized phiE125 gp8 family phage protein
MPPLRERRVERLVPPAVEPLTLAEVKLYLRLSGTAEDALLLQMVTSVRMAAENYLRRSLMQQQWRLLYDDYLPYEVPLPYGPATSIVRVRRLNRDATADILTDDLYQLNASGNRLLTEALLQGWRMEVVYEAGSTNAADIPAPLKQGMLRHLSQLYEQRLPVAGKEIPAEVVGLYHPYREVSL